MSYRTKKENQNDRLNHDKIYIIDIVLKIAENIKIILVLPTIFFIISAIYANFFSNLVYTSESKLMSSSGSGKISQAFGFAAQFGLDLPYNQSGPEWVYPEIIKSRTLSKGVLEKKFDTRRFGEQKSLLEILTAELKDKNYNFNKLLLFAIKKFLGMIDISEDKVTGILKLRVSVFEPALAKDINNAIIEQLIAHQRKYNKSKTSEGKRFIEERIIETEKDLMIAEENLKIFMDRNRRIENSPALQLERQRLGREVTVLTGVFTTLKQQYETTKIEEVKESEYVVILDPPETPIFPSSPNKVLMIFLSTCFGLGVAFIWIFLKEYIVRTKVEEKEKFTTAKSLISNNITELKKGRFL